MSAAWLADLATLLDDAVLLGDGAVSVTGITHDSRTVEPGDLFACVPGSLVDGHDFAHAAIRRGAAALLVERSLSLDDGVPQLLVRDVRHAMGLLAAAINDQPSERLRIVGVTGTNGKTSVVTLIEQVVAHAQLPIRMLGTLTGPRTTPESTELQKTLAETAASGGDVVAMEVSSHALELDRVAGTRFAVGVFTNLGRDHLDFHGTLENYEAAKTKLFSSRFIGTAVINTDDPVGRRIAAQCDVPVVPFGLADAEDLLIDGPVSRFRWRGHEVVLRLPGSHNVSNALAAALACELLGIDPLDITEALCRADSARGRFEMVDVGQPFSVVVDYAHKPEALEAVLVASRQIAGRRIDGSPGTLIVVFGCGGDRDQFKRPVMGEIAGRVADHAYLTSDNPRSEDPETILDQIEAGVSAPDRASVTRIADRAAAIVAALDRAEAGDVVLIAGKGDEVHQVVGDVALPFDDRAVAIAHLLASSDAQPIESQPVESDPS